MKKGRKTQSSWPVNLHSVAEAVIRIRRCCSWLPNDLVRSVAAKSYGVTATGDSVVLPDIMSRKNQIISKLKV